MSQALKCEDCALCSDPEILNEVHYLKNESYCSTRIVSRCLATPHKYIIGCVCADMYCAYKEKEVKTDD